MRWRIFLLAVLWALSLGAQAAPPPAVALFYGAKPPLELLPAFDVAVVEPDQAGLDPRRYRHEHSELFAYVSLGEVQAGKPYYPRLPKAWLRGRNAAWGSELIDQRDPAWPAFVAEHIIAPLWARGYRGFFLDTLDSYQHLAKTAAEREAQAAGLQAAIREIKRRWPEARLIFNRGFELLPAVHDAAWMVAAESLYQRWDAGARRYTEVGAADRDWLLAQLLKVKADYGLPVLAIDYVAPADRALARATAARIRAHGIIPYVADGDLATLGLGNVEALPRKILLVYKPSEFSSLQYSDPQRFLGMPLAYLGYTVEYRDVADLPQGPLQGRYAGVVSWLNDDAAGGAAYARWLSQRLAEQLPVVIFGRFGLGADSTTLGRLGLQYRAEAIPRDIRVLAQQALMGFEMPIQPQPDATYPVQLKGEGESLLRLGQGADRFYDAAAITPWGGYALAPYVVAALPGEAGARWYINPLDFLRRALRHDAQVPVPDVSTEMGRRLLLVHIDGDGFVSQVERPGYPLAGEVLRDEVIQRYRLPTTLSVIEGEVGPAGLYPTLSPRLERTARDLFALPYVELATHSYSHPFYWRQAIGATEQAVEAAAYHLPLPGYVFDLNREIKGSADYIQQRLAPAGKRVKLMLWTGDCVAPPAALAAADQAGLLNMNGGDTLISRSQNSWTRIAGLGVQKAGYYQVFAPNQNENVYTNLWTGPFYGYERVIETFELTESPYRFKPVNIYYHAYAVTKTASREALHKVYRWALAQPLHPVHASDYVNKVLDFNDMVVARTPQGYRVRGRGELRNLRLPAQGPALHLQDSTGLAGVATGPQARYLSLSGGSAELVLGQDARAQPFIESANARLSHFQRQANGLLFGLQGHQSLRFTLGNAQGCQLWLGAQRLQPSRRLQGRHDYELSEHEGSAFRLDCRA